MIARVIRCWVQGLILHIEGVGGGMGGMRAWCPHIHTQHGDKRSEDQDQLLISLQRLRWGREERRKRFCDTGRGASGAERGGAGRSGAAGRGFQGLHIQATLAPKFIKPVYYIPICFSSSMLAARRMQHRVRNASHSSPHAARAPARQRRDAPWLRRIMRIIRLCAFHKFPSCGAARRAAMRGRAG